MTRGILRHVCVVEVSEKLVVREGVNTAEVRPWHEAFATHLDARLEDLEAITGAAFGQRRKMIRKSLKSLTPAADKILEAARVPPAARAEELDLSQFCALARAYAASR